MSGWATRKTAEDIRQIVRSGKAREGGQLPSERDLARTLQVSRATVRSALQILRQDGEVETRQGANGGTFVSKSSRYWLLYSQTGDKANAVISHPTGIPQGIPESIKDEGCTSESVVLEASCARASAPVAAHLEIPQGSNVFRLRRLRKANGESIAVECAYLPCERFPGILEKDLAQSLYLLMQNDYGIKIAHISETFEVALASSAHAHELGIDGGSPLVESTSVAFEENGGAIEYSHDFYRADRIKFVVENDFS